jgi:hypothetical protein
VSGAGWSGAIDDFSISPILPLLHKKRMLPIAAPREQTGAEQRQPTMRRETKIGIAELAFERRSANAPEFRETHKSLSLSNTIQMNRDATR